MIVPNEKARFMKCCVDVKYNCAGTGCMGWIPEKAILERIAMPDEVKELEKEGWRDRCEIDKETGGTVMTKFVPGGRCGRAR